MKIYHNPDCSKCVMTLAILKENDIAPEIVHYLDTPPTAEELTSLVQKLGISPLELIRQNEPIFQEKYAGKTRSDEEWIAAMVAHPILMERPIVIRGDRAVIGRPPVRVLEIL